MPDEPMPTRMHTSENGIVLHMPTVNGRSCRVERSGTLLEGSWTTVEDNIPDTGAAAHPRRFCRTAVET
jgi:hypothetical protein